MRGEEGQVYETETTTWGGMSCEPRYNRLCLHNLLCSSVCTALLVPLSAALNLTAASTAAQCCTLCALLYAPLVDLGGGLHQQLLYER